MRITHLLSSAVMVPLLAVASPPPVLPWAASTMSFALDSGTVEFRMECPGGVLTKLSAIRGQQVTELPVSQLAKLPLSNTCAGASTRAEVEEEGSTTITGIKLEVQLRHEYIDEELWIDFDLQRFKFTKAMHLKTRVGRPTEVQRLVLE